MTIAGDLGMNPERRPVHIEEIFGFVDAGCCGTAAVITPVGSITWRDRKVEYVTGDVPGEHCTRLYERLTGIQLGEVDDEYGWIRKVPAP